MVFKAVRSTLNTFWKMKAPNSSLLIPFSAGGLLQEMRFSSVCSGLSESICKPGTRRILHSPLRVACVTEVGVLRCLHHHSPRLRQARLKPKAPSNASCFPASPSQGAPSSVCWWGDGGLLINIHWMNICPPHYLLPKLWQKSPRQFLNPQFSAPIHIPGTKL